MIVCPKNTYHAKIVSVCRWLFILHCDHCYIWRIPCNRQVISGKPPTLKKHVTLPRLHVIVKQKLPRKRSRISHDLPWRFDLSFPRSPIIVGDNRTLTIKPVQASPRMIPNKRTRGSSRLHNASTPPSLFTIHTLYLHPPPSLPLTTTIIDFRHRKIRIHHAKCSIGKVDHHSTSARSTYSDTTHLHSRTSLSCTTALFTLSSI